MTVLLSEIRQETLPGARLAGFCLVGDWQALTRDVPTAWQKLNAACDPGLRAPIRLGVYPMQDEATGGSSCRYWVTLPVSAHQALPEGMETLLLPQTRFAVARFQGRRYEISEGYRALHDWLRRNRLLPDPAGFGFERYTLARGGPWDGQGAEAPFDFDLYLAVLAEADTETEHFE